MSENVQPRRAIVNFAHRCAMSCEWCYVPFGPIPAHRESLFSIVSRVSELGFNSITIGGGDPFQYSFIYDLLLHAKSPNLFVHVDSHGKSLLESSTNLRLIDASVDLLGLPLDGSTSLVHDMMRSSPGHFDLVAKKLRWLSPLRDRLKVNTVISSANISDVLSLAELVASNAPKRWSIYQYWPLGPASRVSTKHLLSDSDFMYYTEPVNNVFRNSSTIVEINPREARRDTYPIIHHNGEVLVHSAAPENSLVSLGTIFDSCIMDKILSTCRPDRPEAVSRYIN